MTTSLTLADNKRSDLQSFGCDVAGYILFNLATDMFVLVDESGRARWMPAERFQQIMAPSLDPLTETACAASNAIPRSRAEQDRILGEFAENAVSLVLELIEREQRENRVLGRDFTIATEARRTDGALWLQLSAHPLSTGDTTTA